MLRQFLSSFLFLLSFFFFQAEDGIRDLVRSRGLGDLYKRQGDDLNLGLGHLDHAHGEILAQGLAREEPEFGAGAVSYTHLTLPTIYSV